MARESYTKSQCHKDKKNQYPMIIILIVQYEDWRFTITQPKSVQSL